MVGIGNERSNIAAVLEFRRWNLRRLLNGDSSPSPASLSNTSPVLYLLEQQSDDDGPSSSYPRRLLCCCSSTSSTSRRYGHVGSWDIEENILLFFILYGTTVAVSISLSCIQSRFKIWLLRLVVAAAVFMVIASIFPCWWRTVWVRSFVLPDVDAIIITFLDQCVAVECAWCVSLCLGCELSFKNFMGGLL